MVCQLTLHVPRHHPVGVREGAAQVLPDVAPVEKYGAICEQTVEEHGDVCEEHVAYSGAAIWDQVLAVGQQWFADTEEVFGPVPDTGGAAPVHGFVALQTLS